jgi:hypothetical protein
MHPGANAIKPFYSLLMLGVNKLERSFLASFSGLV